MPSVRARQDFSVLYTNLVNLIEWLLAGKARGKEQREARDSDWKKETEK